MLSSSEILRYNRHIIMPEVGIDGQEKLKAAKVLVVGAGGLGSPVLLYLAAAGVGTIGIADFDTVDESNLQRQILYTTEDVGKPKATCAARHLKKLNPAINIIPILERIDVSCILDFIKNYDVVIDCSDNFPTRYLVNDACVLLGKPLVYGAIHKFEGQVSVFNYKNGPTYRCVFPEEPTDTGETDCSRLGVIGAIPGIIGSMQAVEAIKIITGKGEVMSGKLLSIDLFNLSYNVFEFERDESEANITALRTIELSCSLYPELEIGVEDYLRNTKESNEYKIIDIREKYEYDSFNIGGINLPLSTSSLDNYASFKKAILVCWIGEKSIKLAAEIKSQYPETEIYSLKGGIEAILKRENQ